METVILSEKWNKYFISMAELVATKSKDRSTHVGAVIVGPNNEVRSTGYNGFPRFVNDNLDFRHTRPIKYEYTEHAERNAIYAAARVGTPLDGCMLYLNYSPHCVCTGCVRAIIQSGIVRIIGPNRDFPTRGDWAEEFKHSKAMLQEAGVQLIVETNYDKTDSQTGYKSTPYQGP
jgi:dCMP deaminase